MVIIVFRARLRPDVDQQALVQLGQRMHELASSMPGYISYKDFAAGDGENGSLLRADQSGNHAATFGRATAANCLLAVAAQHL
jgi:hypothetical protein